MEWSLSRFWPRAKSKLYEEPKKLERLGLAATARGHRRRAADGLRHHAAGRRALRGLARRSRPTGFGLEAEPLLRVFLADQGTRADTLSTLAGARAWAEERNAGNLAAGRAFLAGGAEFQSRAAPTLLAGAFLTDFYKLVADWADGPPSRSPPGRTTRPKPNPTRGCSARSWPERSGARTWARVPARRPGTQHR